MYGKKYETMACDWIKKLVNYFPVIVILLNGWTIELSNYGIQVNINKKLRNFHF